PVRVRANLHRDGAWAKCPRSTLPHMAAVRNDTPVADSRPVLEASGLAKNFGPVVALRSADLRVRGGEIHALMGANGAGKSTLVKMLTGPLTADGGALSLGGGPRS